MTLKQIGMRDSESGFQLVAFLQLRTDWERGRCLPSVTGTEIQSRCPLRHPKTGTLPTSAWMLALMPICQDGTGPGLVKSSSYALVLCQAWCLVPDLRNLARDPLTAWWPPQTARTYVLNNVLSLVATLVDVHFSKGGRRAPGPFARRTGCLAVGSLEALTPLLLLRDGERVPAKFLGRSVEGRANVSPWQ